MRDTLISTTTNIYYNLLVNTIRITGYDARALNLPDHRTSKIVTTKYRRHIAGNNELIHY